MGFRFRKSVNMGPFRINFSKSGIGYSVGGKGFRYTKKANGGTRTTYSIPGTGISYVEETSAKKNRNRKTDNHVTAERIPEFKPDPIPTTSVGLDTKNNSCRTVYCSHCYKMVDASAKLCPSCGKPLSPVQGTAFNEDNTKKPFYKRWWFVTLVIFCVLNSCSNSDDAIANDPTMDAPTIITETTVLPTESTEPTATATTEEGQPLTLIYDFGSSTGSKAKETTYVLNTNTKKFHYSSCSSAKKIKSSNRSSFTGTRSEVIAKGYSPCGNCHP